MKLMLWLNNREASRAQTQQRKQGLSSALAYVLKLSNGIGAICLFTKYSAPILLERLKKKFENGDNS